jgi:hypothetical protein
MTSASPNFQPASTVFVQQRWFQRFLLLAFLLISGCGAERESLFEDEHDLPAHWPSGLSDAADKIEQRMNLLAGNPTNSSSESRDEDADRCESELRDLVEWIPEVAADTELTEEQWLPIYQLCEVMREHLSRGDVNAQDIEEDFDRLQALLVESAELLASSKPPLVTEELDKAELDSPEPSRGDALADPITSGDEP